MMKLGLGREAADGAAFDAAVEGRSDGSAYQAAANLLIARRGQAALNRFVREIVLQAHKPTLAELARKGDLDWGDFTDAYCEAAEREDDWYIPSAVNLLARQLVADSAIDRALVITTNFDPLIEIAVRRAGGNPITLKFTQDGQINDVVPTRDVVVAHLHGFWRDGDTLHVPAQLMQERPRLQRSLEDLLNERTLVVSGYGGWDDIFSSALTEAVRHHGKGELNVLWVLRDLVAQDAAAAKPALLGRFGSAAGQVQFYCGCDCEKVFELVEKAAAGREERGDDFSSPMPGWSAITPQFLDTQRTALGSDELSRFFDGQVPTWRHAESKLIPRLSAACKAIAAVEEGSGSSLNVVAVLGPSGEGKSAALVQTAATIGRQDGWRVLWRETSANATFDFAGLERGDWRWLLVLDEAAADASKCLQAMHRMHEMGRNDITLLLSAQLSDWRGARAQALPWAEYSQLDEVDVRGIDSEDAVAVIEAWEAAGSLGLGELATLPGRDQRVTALMEAASSEALSPDGSLFGAMLQIRIGAGLRDHVRTLGERLRRRHTASGKSLLRTLLYVASLHSREVTSLTPMTLAEAIGIPVGDIHREVVWPLGDEAALARSGLGLQVRHREIAVTAMELVDTWGEDPAEIYYEIIRAAASVRHKGGVVPDLADFVYLSTRMTDMPSTAIRAAQAPVDVEPERLAYCTSLASVLRKCKRPQDGLDEARKAYAIAEFAPDKENLRGVINEWAVCAGAMKRYAAKAYLCLSAMTADLPGDPLPTSNKEMEFLAKGVMESLPRAAGSNEAGHWSSDTIIVAERIRRAAKGHDAISDVDAAMATLRQAAVELGQLVEEDLPEPFASGARNLRFTELQKYAPNNA